MLKKPRKIKDKRKVIPLLSETVVENIIKKVAEEPVPQHVIDEAVADASRARTKELRQKEMYDSEDWNWSGFR